MSLLLDPGQKAELVLDGGWRTAVVVAGAEPRCAQMRATMGTLALPDRLRWAGATLEWDSEEGMIRRSGILAGSDADGVLTLTANDARAFEQRRRHERVRAELDARIRTGEMTLAATTLDVSANGMLLGGAATLDVPAEIDFTLFLSGAAVSGNGVVVRSTADGARGVQFAAIDGVGASTLEQWLEARITAI